jgi:hypothetical protein
MIGRRIVMEQRGREPQEAQMAQTEWMIRGPEIVACNCDYSCPCQFNALPTDGTCRAAFAMQIDEGRHATVKLDGLRWAFVVAWPGAIHQGHGEFLPIVDERATPEQRVAIHRIITGQDTEPGATYFQVFNSMCDTVHPPLFSEIHFEADLDSCEGHFSVPDLVQTKTHAIRNPVTGKIHHPKVSIRAGFEFTEAEFASGTVKAHGAITVETHNKHAHLAMIHMTGKGVVH